MNRRIPLVLWVALGFAAQVGCEGLGDFKSGKLACSKPQGLCPTGFSCNEGLCWKNGSLDAPTEVAGDRPSADSPEESLGGNTNGSVAMDAGSDAFDGAASERSDCEVGYRQCPGAQRCVRNSGCCGDGDCSDKTPACVSGVCTARSNGDSCTSDTECGSGHCAVTAGGASTKVCCDSACSGNCNDGCGAGTCKHKPFRTSCGEIDSAHSGPRYYLCDGSGNCNPPAFPCGGKEPCAATTDVACCSDPNDDYRPACVAFSLCGQGAADFEQSCNATIDCPLGTYCCLIQNPDMQITACAPNCQTYAPAGFNSASYAHGQACDYVRDSSCPSGQHCGAADSFLGTSMCGN
jgi:hypothetical protein